MDSALHELAETLRHVNRRITQVAPPNHEFDLRHLNVKLMNIAEEIKRIADLNVIEKQVDMAKEREKQRSGRNCTL